HLLPVLPAGAPAGGLLRPQVRTRRPTGVVLAPLGRRRGEAGAADPGGRDRARHLVALAALPDPPQPRLRDAAVLDAGGAGARRSTPPPAWWPTTSSTRPSTGSGASACTSPPTTGSSRR